MPMVWASVEGTTMTFWIDGPPKRTFTDRIAWIPVRARDEYSGRLAWIWLREARFHDSGEVTFSSFWC